MCESLTIASHMYVIIRRLNLAHCMLLVISDFITTVILFLPMVSYRDIGHVWLRRVNAGAQKTRFFSAFLTQTRILCVIMRDYESNA